jgi:hypothetical protein
MNQYLINAAGILSFLNLAYFAWRVWTGRVPPASTASWLMWVILDSVILGASIATGQPYALALSYTLGAATVLAANLKRGRWVWTRVETFSAIGAAIATVVWQSLDAEWGVVAGVIAMTLAGYPLAKTIWTSPNPGYFWMLANTAIACILTLIGTLPWTIGGSLLSGAGLAFNGTLAALSLRKKPGA